MPLQIGLAVPPEPSPNRERLKTALCLLAILAAVAVSFRPGGIFGDDEQYLYLVKGLFTGHPFQNLRDAGGDGNLFLLRPLGYPLFLSLFYPILGQHWELYPFITATFCVLLGVVTFFFFRLRMDKGYALVFTLAMLCNPMIRLWSTNAYSDIPFAFFMVLFIYLFTTKRALDALPFLALFMVSLRTTGLPLAFAYGVALAVRKEKARLAILAGLLAIYFAAQQWYFGEIPGLQEYFRANVQDGTGSQSLPGRMVHNMASLLFGLLSSTFFYGGYAWMPASFLKSFLCLMTGGAALLCLAIAAGRSVFLNLLIAGYFGVILMLRPEDLMHRILIPLIPLVFLGAGRLAAVAEGLYMPRVKQALVGVALLAAIDGVVSMRSYQSGFHPRDYSDIYHAGETAPGLTERLSGRPVPGPSVSERPASGRSVSEQPVPDHPVPNLPVRATP